VGSTHLRKDFVEQRNDVAARGDRALDDAYLTRHLRLTERKSSQILTMLLEAVEYQPEASRRERPMMGQEAVTSPLRPHLRLVSGGMDGRHGQLTGASDGFDDPGSSAA
jgi:hypothetical protein